MEGGRAAQIRPEKTLVLTCKPLRVFPSTPFPFLLLQHFQRPIDVPYLMSCLLEGSLVVDDRIGCLHLFKPVFHGDFNKDICIFNYNILNLIFSNLL